ncbi:MAG: DNA-directed RNA polymerase subunit beta' [Symbiobacteriaceae bacterium]|nr:DNA-directed RNA polymerase subunit beta' [Symbiobacteriaceae bacterium]
MLDVNIASMSIGLASPALIRQWSRGEVKKPETINYRTLKPEKDGLFCEKIFGPTKDWECYCGKYKRVRFKGIICDRCGVEVTRQKVRRERMGHIELAAPVSHIWFLKGIPSRMGLIMDMSPRALERVLYFAAHVVLDPGENTGLKRKDILSETEYREYRDKFGSAFRAGIGAEAIKELLMDINPEALCATLREEIRTTSGQRRTRAIHRLEVAEAFRASGNAPQWMIMDVIPVIPPEIRPMVQLDGGRFATCDLNDLYRRVINRNNRLKKLLELGAPDIIVRNEKRMLQEAVDALIDNGRRGRPVTGAGNRPLKSLSDMLKGKQGRFRQNLLGKRVDYSGRSVIVVGPELKLHQCGLPKEMALELFKPFVMKKLVQQGHAHNIKSAKRKVERESEEVWDVLEEVIQGHPVLLNRAPTLHRLGIQAFEPILVEGRAIKLHPLVCHGYNADFDGDQMAVHVPLSAEAQAEARFLMMSTNNILNPKDARPEITPQQDMILGSYYLTLERPGALGSGKSYLDMEEALMAYQSGDLHLQAPIRVRRTVDMPDGTSITRTIPTTIGRLIFNEKMPQDLGYVDRTNPANACDLEVSFVCKKDEIIEIAWRVYEVHGNARTAEVLNELKNLSFNYATRAGISIGLQDVTIPPVKEKILEATEAQVAQIEDFFNMGHITAQERYKEVVDLWDKATKEVQRAVTDSMDTFNPIKMMATSKARANPSQLSQLAGMRGLMKDPTGRTIDLPIKANFREGLTVLEYFISTHGTRKGLADTALRTADSGYLTRRLVDVSQDVIVREEDCGSTEGIYYEGIVDGSRVIEKFEERIVGRYTVDDIPIPDLVEVGSGRLVQKAQPLTCRSWEDDGGDIPYFVRQNQIISPAIGAAIASYGIVYSDTEGRTVLYDDAVGVLAEDGSEKRYPIFRRLDGTPQRVKVGEGEFVRAGDPLTDALISGIYCRSALTCQTRHGVCIKCYGRNMATGRVIDIGEAVGIIAAQSIGEPGTQLTMRTFHTGGVATSEDITQGLPRVEEVFEARRPKHPASLAEISGIVKVNERNNKREVTISSEDGDSRTYAVNYGGDLLVRDGETVEIGTILIADHHVNPHELLAYKGISGVRSYMVQEIQKVYRNQGVELNDKHIEVIVRQMLKKVKVEDAGDTSLLPGATVDILDFQDANLAVLEEGGELAVARPILLGITKASLATDSFLSAASFQETTRVLTEAAIKGKNDPLIGLKENMIIGKLVPAGTGMMSYRNLEVITAPEPLIGLPASVEEDETPDEKNREIEGL